MEAKIKDRGWVKNVAIIFLAVMLVLTFFSNTFMNRSLPEVATQSVQSDSISAQIRGTGTVAANQNYDVKINQTRKVESVLVKDGDEVSTGDILFILGAGDSDELTQAQEQLRQLTLSYNKALINAADNDYAKENREIQNAKKDLEDAEAKLELLAPVSDSEIAGLKAQIADAKEKVSSAKKDVSAIEKEISDLEADAPSNSGDSATAEAALKTAEDALDRAKSALRDAEREYGTLYDFMVAVAKDEIDGDGKDISDARIYMYLPYIAELITGKSTTNAPSVPDSENDTTKQDVRDLQEKYDSMPDSGSVSERLDGHLGSYANRYISRNQFEMDNYYPSEYYDAYNAVVDAMNNVTKCQTAVDDAEAAVDDASGDRVYSAKLRKLKDQLRDAQQVQSDAETTQSDLETKLSDLQTKQSEYNTALDTVKSQQKTLEDLIFALQEQQKTDDKNQKLENLDLSDMAYQIAQQQKKVDSYSADSQDNEIKAPVSGIVRNISVTAGNTTTADTAMAQIEIPDMGYSMSFSVTNEQARQVHSGDTATVSNYYWGNTVEATLTGIKPDPKNAQTNKLLVFDLKGDVSVGAQLTISIGQKSAQYDYVVPNSAIRSDNNGSFVLVVTAKSSPLGNRYTATRVDVNVLASDDTKTAVSGGLNAGDFVITTSTAPIKNGDRVRMAESGS